MYYSPEVLQPQEHVCSLETQVQNLTLEWWHHQWRYKKNMNGYQSLNLQTVIYQTKLGCVKPKTWKRQHLFRIEIMDKKKDELRIWKNIFPSCTSVPVKPSDLTLYCCVRIWCFIVQYDFRNINISLKANKKELTNFTIVAEIGSTKLPL